MRAECNVYISQSNRDDYELRWYRQLNGKIEPEHLTKGQSINVISRNTVRNVLGSRFQLIIKNSTTDAGVYWCQVIHKDSDDKISFLKQSQKVSLRPAEAYPNLPPCPLSYFMSVTPFCADIQNTHVDFDTNNYITSPTLQGTILFSPTPMETVYVTPSNQNIAWMYLSIALLGFVVFVALTGGTVLVLLRVKCKQKGKIHSHIIFILIHFI